VLSGAFPANSQPGPVAAAVGSASPAVPAVVFDGVTKRFGERLANDAVTFEVRAGTVLALVGENGAGKTTSMNVLAGIYLPEAGRVVVHGHELALGSPRAALDVGVGMVPQHQRLVESLTVAENISLVVDRGRVWQPRSLPARVDDVRRRLGFDVDFGTRVWQLTLAQRQQVEILRTLASGATILVLDEPTAVLSPLETVQLFEILRGVAGMGHAVVLITHKLDEVLRVADEAVVMRRGRVVHQGSVAATDVAALASLVVGERGAAAVRRPHVDTGEAVLHLEGVWVRDDLGRDVVRNVSLRVDRGEVVALVGVTGNGQSELLDAIGGLRPVQRGRIDAPWRGGRRAFAFVPEERLGVGLAPGLPLADNALLGRQWFPPFGRWLRRRAVLAHAGAAAGLLGVDANPSAPVSHLSGGNLQRVVLGREIAAEPDLVVAAFPTRGLDVGTAARIREALVELAEAGCGVLVASEELEESLAIATRVAVMHAGRVVGVFAAEDVDMDRLARLMTTGEAA
jgi:general nucleoside transport system ATP-binding protein